MDELELIRKLKAGDEPAFEQLVDDYGKKIYSTALRILGDADAAQDASQDVFLKIYGAAASFKGNSALSTWIYRITVNVCLDSKRRQRRLKLYTPPDGGEDEDPQARLPDPSPRPDEAYESRETRAEILDALKMLDDDQRTAVVLRDIQGLSYIEAAEAMGCAEGTFKSRLSRARGNLREILSERGNFFARPASKSVKEGERS